MMRGRTVHFYAFSAHWIYSSRTTAMYMQWFVAAHTWAWCGYYCFVHCAYGAIRLDGALSISLGWIGRNVAVFLAIFISPFGRINHSSQLALRVMRKRQARLRSVGNQAHSKCLRMEMRSLRDLRVRIGSAFFYDKILLLTTFQLILQNISNLLLLH